MKKMRFLIMLAILCGSVLGCTSPLIESGDHWRGQVAKVTIGMPRAEVEKILPPYPRSPVTTGGTGGSQSVAYWVGQDWCVSIAYDYTGVPRDDKGMALSRQSPENRVLTMPVLSRKTMPVVEVKSIMTIEQQGGGYSPPAARPAQPTP
jgi:hypothetical protein